MIAPYKVVAGALLLGLFCQQAAQAGWHHRHHHHWRGNALPWIYHNVIQPIVQPPVAPIDGGGAAPEEGFDPNPGGEVGIEAMAAAAEAQSQFLQEEAEALVRAEQTLERIRTIRRDLETHLGIERGADQPMENAAPGGIGAAAASEGEPIPPSLEAVRGRPVRRAPPRQ